MSLARRIVPAVVCLALGVGAGAVAPASTASAAGPVARSAPRAASDASCVEATTTVAKVKRIRAKTLKHKVDARAKLARAKRTHKPARIRRARAGLATWKALDKRAVLALQIVKAQRATACRATPGTPGTPGTPTSPSAPPKVVKAVGTGALLGLLSAGSNAGSVPNLDLGQLTSLLDGLYPGASDLLDVDQLTSMLAGFTSVGGLDASQLTGLLGMLGDLGGLGDLAGLDPTDLLSVLSGAAFDPSQLTALVATVTDLLGSLGGAAFFDPTDPIGTMSGLITALLGGITTVPVEILGSLLGLLTAAANDGSMPDLDLSGFTAVLDKLYPGASNLLSVGDLGTMFSMFTGAGDLGLSQLTSLLDGLAGGAGLNPLQLLGMLDGSPLGAGQLASLTDVVTGLLSGVTGASFSSPGDPLSLLGSLLGDLLGGILCGLLGC